MNYQTIVNLLDKTLNQLSKFRTGNWAEINEESQGMNNINSQITFKPSILKSSSCDFSYAYILLSGIITIAEAKDDAAARQANKRNKGVIFKNCAYKQYTNI